MKRIKSAVIWTLLAVLVFGIILILVYAINGYVEYDTTLLTSGLASLSDLDGLTQCIDSQGAATLCSALGPNAVAQTWSQRPSFLIFVIAVASILGWLLLMVMGGVGIIALPLDMILTCALVIFRVLLSAFAGTKAMWLKNLVPCRLLSWLLHTQVGRKQSYAS